METEDIGGELIGDRSQLLAALEVESDADLEDRLHGAAEVDVYVEWEDDPPGIIVQIDGLGTILPFPFTLPELWAEVRELDDDRVTALNTEGDLPDETLPIPESPREGPSVADQARAGPQRTDTGERLPIKRGRRRG